MQLPAIPGLSSLAALAGFLRARLLDVGDTATRQAAVVIVSATAPFATTSYARARLLRQMHASGLLTLHETEQAERLLRTDRC
jgi:hypothetical protein